MTYVSQRNLEKEKVLKLIYDLQSDFYSSEENWGEEFTVEKGIRFARKKQLDKYLILNNLTTIEDKELCLLRVKNKDNVLFENIDKMLIDTYRMEVINMDKGGIIDLDKVDKSVFNNIDKKMVYCQTKLTDMPYVNIDTVYGRWYYGNYIVSNGQGFSPFDNTIVRFAKNVLGEKYKNLLRDYPTVSFEFKLMRKSNNKNTLVLVGAVDIITQIRYTNSLLKNIGNNYQVPTMPTVVDDNVMVIATDINRSFKNCEYIYFDYVGKRYKTKNEEYKNILKNKKVLY